MLFSNSNLTYSDLMEEVCETNLLNQHFMVYTDKRNHPNFYVKKEKMELYNEQSLEPTVCPNELV